MKLSKFQRALYLLVLLGWGICAPAQTPADVRLGELLNRGDLFRLRDEYPQLKDSLSIGMLDLLARSQLGVGFNRPEEAAPALDSLLLLHQEALGAESTLSMAALRAMNLLNLGMYAQAGAAAGDLVRVLEKSLPFESYFGLVFIERIGKALSDVPAPRLERPDRTVTVPMRYGEVGRGHHLYIPVEVNGQRRDFIFDTGCPFGCFVSEGYAEEVGLRIVADSIPVSGMAIGFVKLAVADSLRIGGMVYHHPFCRIRVRRHHRIRFAACGRGGRDRQRDGRVPLPRATLRRSPQHVFVGRHSARKDRVRRPALRDDLRYGQREERSGQRFCREIPRCRGGACAAYDPTGRLRRHLEGRGGDAPRVPLPGGRARHRAARHGGDQLRAGRRSRTLQRVAGSRFRAGLPAADDQLRTDVYPRGIG